MNISCCSGKKEAEKLTCELNCQSQCIDFLRSMVEAMARRAGLDACHSNRVALAVDELFANIAEHGYRGEPGRIELEAHIECPRQTGREQHELVFDFRDFVSSGWTYDPCKVDTCTIDPDTISPGGLGLKLIKAVADRFEQQKLADGNRWRLVFLLGTKELDRGSEI